MLRALPSRQSPAYFVILTFHSYSASYLFGGSKRIASHYDGYSPWRIASHLLSKCAKRLVIFSLILWFSHEGHVRSWIPSFLQLFPSISFSSSWTGLALSSPLVDGQPLGRIDGRNVILYIRILWRLSNSSVGLFSNRIRYGVNWNIKLLILL